MTVAQPAGPMPPQPPQRPALISSIAIATELWLVVIVALALTQIGSYPTVRDAMDKRLAELPKDASETVRRSAEMMTNPGLIVASLVVAVLVGAAIALTAMYFARAGYTWARLILSGLSAYVLVGGVMAFAGERVWTQAPQIVAGVCAAAALLLLMRRDADTYCREMAQFRAYAKTPAALAQAFPTTPWQGYSQPPAPNHRNEGTGHPHE
ncbi:MAG TPA: hypothetical protein PK331_14055 [Gordonia sp. (in: high G+C Gram-positive bacteria)]|uniref:hypothetical protein n=1 Tax=unclassified Gordonia (in: high G+C Gram-positive bacteria) TaxID=2657482 RepID=UPI000FA04023|nr:MULTISPECIES: hypothetical protein [unclassified Gordonia (in: high G+C Gram-positive bacteria)]RUP39600.1 MAG: hypothetical protein EKK60_06095 [Gordonia sp. (in: high G+C Gram-positive bacteria)]HNP57035.1 hypothetical protein [Gordonia sp. (in: high G+C Gram-positive bacteria)]HRC52029.1 hypothetical protein [Gordonia sp. (in: high G+C Gram-positive bacteria)]